MYINPTKSTKKQTVICTVQIEMAAVTLWNLAVARKASGTFSASLNAKGKMSADSGMGASRPSSLNTGLVINYGEGGLQSGKIAGPKLFAPPPL